MHFDVEPYSSEKMQGRIHSMPNVAVPMCLIFLEKIYNRQLQPKQLLEQRR
jgi:H+/gluconate symporter-like permease